MAVSIPSPAPQGRTAPTHSDIIKAHHETAKMMYDDASTNHDKLSNLKTNIFSLLEMGDMVKPEDVVDTASKLISKGADPTQMATWLADMPENGPAINQWLVQYAKNLITQGQKSSIQLNFARHNLGVSAMHQLMDMSFPPSNPGMSPQSQSPAMNPQSPSVGLNPQTPSPELNPQVGSQDNSLMPQSLGVKLNPQEK